MKKNRKLIVLILCALVLVGVLVGVYLATRPAPAEGSKTFTVEVVHSDGNSKTFTYHTDADYVGEVLVKEGLVSGEDSAYGLMVLEVDGEKAVYEETGAYWAFYENGAYANQGVDTTPVTDGGSYGFTYTVG